MNARVKVGDLEIELQGEPGGVVRSVAFNPDTYQGAGFDSLVGSAVNHTMESVVLALYQDGKLTPEVLASLNFAMEVVSSNFEKIVEDGLVRSDSDPYSIAAKKFLAGEEQEFDGKVFISHADNGAWVSGWSWVGDGSVLVDWEQRLKESGVEVASIRKAFEEIDLSAVSDGEVLERVIDEVGVQEAFVRIKPLLGIEIEGERVAFERPVGG